MTNFLRKKGLKKSQKKRKAKELVQRIPGSSSLRQREYRMKNLLHMKLLKDLLLQLSRDTSVLNIILITGPRISHLLEFYVPIFFSVARDLKLLQDEEGKDY